MTDEEKATIVIQDWIGDDYYPAENLVQTLKTAGYKIIAIEKENDELR